MKRSPGSIWIVKPPGEMCGNGIRLVMDPKVSLKGGQQSLFLYVTEAIKWLPVDGLTPNFACTEHLGC